MAYAHFMNLALAVKYGTNESLFLTNLCFWIEKNKANRVNHHEGHYWVYNTMDAWVELFPYFSKDQIRHLIEKMKTKGILLVGVFNRIRYDRTQWYSVSEEVMALYLRGNNNSPNGQLEVGNNPVPSAPEGTWKREKSQIDVEKVPVRSVKSPTAIPYNKHIYKPDAAVIMEKQENKEAAPEDKEKIEKIINDLKSINSRLIFDSAFYPKALNYIKEKEIPLEYLKWLYHECEGRKTRNLRGLYHTLFFTPDMFDLFMNHYTHSQSKKPTACPVCGIVHNSFESLCPKCGISYADTFDEAKIEYYKKIYALNAKDRAAYEQEKEELLNLSDQQNWGFVAIKEKWHEIEKKYHILE